MNRTFSKTIDGIRNQCRSLLLAVSGGIDSMCMADLFAGLDEQLPFAVAHCNFGLRGQESDGDEALVRGWAEENGILFHVKRFDTTGYAHKKGISIEMAARELRYGWFSELCAEHGYDTVAVAHNANDNAETLMLNLLRGAGMNGLSGMSLISAIPIDFHSGPVSEALPPESTPVLLRPLLQFTRKQIEGHVFARKIPYRNDSTNASSEYRRNRIRNEVFPIFETINPSFIRTLNHNIGNFAEAGDIVTDYCRAIAPSLLSETPENGILIDLKKLLEQKHWRYLLYFILEPYGFNSATLSSIENLLASSRTVSGKTFSSSTHMLIMERNHLIISPFSTAQEPRNDSGTADMMIVPGEGTYRFNGRTFKVEVIPWASDMPLKQPEGVLIMDAARLSFPLVLRTWRPGDWFIPLGMRGKKKVSDLFTDLKFTSSQKKSAVMLVTSHAPGTEPQHIAALACLRIDNRCRITSGTLSAIRISEHR